MDPRFAAAKRFAEEDEGEEAPGGDVSGGDGEEAGTSGDDEENGEEGNADGEEAPKKKMGLSELSKKKLERIKANIEKTGIVYISRVPPFMKPQKLKQTLSHYAEIGRIYLAPEDTGARARRKKAGGNSGKRFTEGWVEFLDKKKAKTVAAMLNGQQIGGKKRSAFYYDLWNLKYLSKFKWDHLTEEITYQKAVREQKLALELSAGKRERDFYLKQVDQAKAVAAMDERRQKKAQEGGGEGAGAGAKGAAAAAPAKARERKYFQRQARADPHANGAISEKLVSGLFAQGGGGSAKKKRKAGEDD